MSSSRVLRMGGTFGDVNEFALMSGERLSKIALIGNYLPRKCGIATFTTRPSQGSDAPRIRAGMFRRCRE